MINISGGTEVGACFLSPHPVQDLTPMTLGGPALGMPVDVYDEEGEPVREQVGELVCTGPWPGMTRGLWKAPERYLETYWSRWPDVWVHGDWASIEDGRWYLHGRSDDTIKVAGKRLGPAEVESALVSHPAVVEAAAVGVPDEVKGEALWALVVPAAGVTARRGAAGRAGRPRGRAPRAVVPAQRGAVHDRAAEDPQRQGGAAGDPGRGDRSGPRRPVLDRGPGCPRRGAGGVVTAQRMDDEGAHRWT